MSITRIFVATLLLVLLAGPADAAFYFDNSNVTIDVDSSETNDDFSKSFTIRFKSVCARNGCEEKQHHEQNYKFGLSSSYIAPYTDDGVDGSGPGGQKPSLQHDEWFEELESAKVSGFGESRKLPLKNTRWSGSVTANDGVAPWRTATVEITFNDDALEDVNSGECKDFYLVGMDNEGAKFWDTLEICLREKDNRTVKISHLAPVKLVEANNTPERASVLPFCVYVSDGTDYWLRAWGKHVDNFNRFNLSNGNDQLPYNIQFSPSATGNNNWIPLAPGDAVTGKGNDHRDTECGGQNNARFRIYLSEPTVNASGTYSDIVTVTVTPK